MVTLQALLNSITALSYVVDMKFIRDLNDGLTKEYKVWLKPDNAIYEQNISIKVKDLGLPSESAELYNPDSIFYPTTPFKDTIDAATPAFLAANPLIEKIIPIYIDEINKVAEFYMWVKEADPSIITVKKRYVVIDKGGLQIREVKSGYTVMDIATGIANIIEQGIGPQ